MAEVIINVENLTLHRDLWRPEWVEAAGIVSHHGFVVRCRDCKYHQDHNFGSKLDWCTYFHHDVHLDGFCKWGERK